MLAFILNQKPVKIILNKLVNIKDIDEYEIITDSDDIEKLTISHFQNAGIIEDENTDNHHYNDILPPEINNLFDPKSDINSTWYDKLEDEITKEELCLVLQQLPKHKAPGPNKITYEYYTFCDDSMINIILLLFNIIWKQGIYPSNWNEALVYPIPKKDNWNNNLQNV